MSKMRRADNKEACFRDEVTKSYQSQLRSLLYGNQNDRFFVADGILPLMKVVFGIGQQSVNA